MTSCFRLCRFVTALAAGLLSLLAARPVEAQLDPLLFLKNQRNYVVVAVDTSERMLFDADGDYYDPAVYTRSGDGFESALGVSSSTANSAYRRRYREFRHTSGGAFAASSITTVGNLQSGYSTFDSRTRLSIARLGLQTAVTANRSSVRFGLLKTRQTSVEAGSTQGGGRRGNTRGVVVSLPFPQESDYPNEERLPGNWTFTRNRTGGTNGAAASSTATVVRADTGTSNTTVLSALTSSTSLVPASADALGVVDAPVDTMLDDARAEAVRLIAADVNCRNTAVVLVVGGGRGTTTSGSLTSKASTFLSVSGRRVPIYVIAIAPPAADVSTLQQVASLSGGRYTEITKDMIDDTPAGQPVPAFVRAVNEAAQHTFGSQTNFNTAPTAANPMGPVTEFPTTSPVVGSVNLRDGVDINRLTLPATYITTAAGVEIPQRSNVMVTSSFVLPGFEGKLRAFRMYRPVADATRPSGYRFTQDGTRLWEARTPSASQRNIFTVLPNGTMVKFDESNASSLAPYLRATDAEDLIEFVRNQPLGAVISSTPAFMDPPSLDPAPDADYVTFRTANAGRRSMIFVGANDGMLHAIDARTGLEVWAFIPFNLLPKLRALEHGEPVDGFQYFVDSSPKIADVRSNGQWRTYLIVGQGAGGTFYNTFDVTLDGLANAISATSSNESTLLAHFGATSAIPFVWSFPRLTSFDPNLLTYGDVSASASSVEKSVGQTWSDPAVGQVQSASGPYEVFVGSGFLPFSQQNAAHRSGVVAGTTFYVLDIETGVANASRSVGSDGFAETTDSCVTAGSCMQLKNALQMDPVATGPADSRFVSRVYIGDLDGRVWRMDLSVTNGLTTVATPVKLWEGAKDQPLFASMATVNVGGSKQYIFIGTGSDLLPSLVLNDTVGGSTTPTKLVDTTYKLLVLLDNGASATKSAEIALAATDASGEDEKVTAFPAVAGDIVFFSTTGYYPLEPCDPFDAGLYAFTFIGGPAYDTNGDGKLTTGGTTPAKRNPNSNAGGNGNGNSSSNNTSKGDTALVQSVRGVRATAPFIVDQHLVFAAGNNIQMFGDPQDFNNGVGQVGVRILSWRNPQ